MDKFSSHVEDMIFGRKRHLLEEKPDDHKSDAIPYARGGLVGINTYQFDFKERKDEKLKPLHNPVYHPKHYTSHPSGVECITIAEHFSFNIGNCMKYLWRAGLKNGATTEDLKKAQWYLSREISNREKAEKMAIDKIYPCRENK